MEGHSLEVGNRPMAYTLEGEGDYGFLGSDTM
jgi:hypothetical protein